MPDPPVTTRDEWLAARRELLAQERELTRQRDAVNAARRRLPPPARARHVVQRHLARADREARALQAADGLDWLDLTALGRQEDWEQPAGRGKDPALSWVRRHDDYEPDVIGGTRAPE